MKIRDMVPAEVGRLYELAGIVGWNQSMADCRFLLSAPWCRVICVEENGEIVATAGAPVYGETGFINMVIVHPDFRRRGLATAMIRHLLETLKVRTFRLHATPAGSCVYGRMGFSTTRTMSYLVADRPVFKAPALSVEPASLEDIGAIAALDLRNCGMNRRELLTDNLNRFGKFALKISEGGKPAAFALGRRGRKQRQIAAVESADGDWEKAFALIAAAAPMEEELPTNIIFFDADKAALKTAAEGGFEKVRELIEMEYGVPGAPPGAGYHAIFGGDFG